AGIQTVLEERLHRAGVPASGLWARVPPYLAGGAHPPAALALVRTLGRLTGVEVETTELEAATKDHLEQVEEAIRERPQIAEFVDQIRGLVEQGADERIPSGDEIAPEPAAQVEDVDLDPVGVGGKVAAPHPGQQLLAPQDLARPAHEGQQQLELPPGQVDAPAPP